jgi:hypothetical protein
MEGLPAQPTETPRIQNPPNTSPPPHPAIIYKKREHTCACTCTPTAKDGERGWDRGVVGGMGKCGRQPQPPAGHP